MGASNCRVPTSASAPSPGSWVEESRHHPGDLTRDKYRITDQDHLLYDGKLKNTRFHIWIWWWYVQVRTSQATHGPWVAGIATPYDNQSSHTPCESCRVQLLAILYIVVLAVHSIKTTLGEYVCT